MTTATARAERREPRPQISRSRKITLLTVSLAQGGAEALVVQLAQALHGEGWNVSVVSMLKPEAFSQELEGAGVHVTSLDMKAGRLNLAGVIRFFGYLRKFRPEIVHAHMYHANILARLARVLTGLKVVCTVQNEKESSRRKDSARIREWIYRLTNWTGSQNTVVSQVVRRRYVRDRIFPASRIEAIPNGIDIQPFQDSPLGRERMRAAMGWNSSFLWLSVGRLELAKDFPNLIQAFEQVRKANANARLAIAGEGRLRAEIQALISARGLDESVQLLGSRWDIPDLLNACDAFVLASAWEGMPLVLLEAAACGRVVVATSVGGATEIVIPDETGYLAPSGDAQELARWMEHVMSLPPEARDGLGQAGRRHVQRHYTISAVTAAYVRLYHRALGAASGPTAV